MSRRALLIGLCVVLLLAGIAWLRWLARAPTGTDQEQILAQIERGERAAELLSSSGLIRLVSPDYRDDLGLTRPALSYQTRRELREAQRLEVTIPASQLRIQVAPDGRTATSTGPVELRITGAQGGTRTLSLTPTLRWRKERVRRYLLFPVEEWRVVKAEGLTTLGE
jgi:hypothetical protein